MISTQLRRGACPLCGCLCADAATVWNGDRFVEPVPACPLAARGFTQAAAEATLAAQVFGAPAGWEAACAEAARRLAEARAPLMWLGAGLAVEGVEESVRLARRLEAALDAPSPAAQAAADPGSLSCTLGEARALPGVRVVWGAEPGETHPRFWEQLADPDRPRLVFAVNSRLPEGVAPEAAYASGAGGSLPDLTRLRLAEKDRTVELPEPLARLAQAVREAPGGVVIYGRGLEREGPAALVALQRWVHALAERGRWYALALPADPTPGETLLNTLGFTGALRFRAGQAEYAPGLWSAPGLLARGETDLALLVGETPDLSPQIRAALERIPVVAFSPAPPPVPTAAWLPVARPGLDGAGTRLRLDGTPVQLRACLASKRPALEAALRAVGAKEAA